MYVYTCIHICIYIYTCICNIYIYIYTHAYIYIYIQLHTYAHTHICALSAAPARMARSCARGRVRVHKLAPCCRTRAPALCKQACPQCAIVVAHGVGMNVQCARCLSCHASPLDSWRMPALKFTMKLLHHCVSVPTSSVHVPTPYARFCGYADACAHFKLYRTSSHTSRSRSLSRRLSTRCGVDAP